jgi:protein phosphatase
MLVRAYAFSVTGNVRSLNEDSYFIGNRCWAVADGMGGQAAGDVASSIIVNRLRAWDASIAEDINELVERLNAEILGYGATHPFAAGLGSTLSGVLAMNLGGVDHLSLFNVGDSRIYRLSDGVLSLRSVDHNEAAELLRSGAITVEESRHHRGKSVLTRSLGQLPAPTPEITVLPQRDHDRFLICSDGLSNEVDDDQIAEVLGADDDLKTIAHRLIDHALANGGRDNITAVVLQLEADRTEMANEDTIPNLMLLRGDHA